MGSRGDSGNDNKGSANNTPPSKRKYDVSGTLSDPREKDDTEAKKSLFREQGATDISNAMDTPFMPMVGRALAGPLKAGSRINRDYFTNKVLGTGGYKNVSREDFQRKTLTEQNRIYKDYMDKRLSGETDARGNKLNRSDNNNSTVQPKVAAQMDAVKPTTTPSGPTDVEVGQTYTDAALERKKKGRRSTVLTSITGDTSTPKLSKKVLLGG